jgi:predicted TIM-barrel fold metal-dependent hydrolase
MIDCHYHLDESSVSVDGLLKSMDTCGVSRTALIAPMCPDIKHNLFMAVASPVFLRLLRSKIKAANAAVRAIYNSWVKENCQVAVGGRLYPLTAQPDNERIAQVVQEYPERFYGWIFVNPKGLEDPVSQIDRYSKIPGMIGVKAHPFWHSYPVSKLTDTAACCQEKRLPMLIHLGVGENGDFAWLAKNFPKVNFIFAHAGIPYQRAVCALAASAPNVFVDISCSSYINVPIAKMAVKLAGAKKCLWGSDGPYFHHKDDRFDYNFYVQLLKNLNLNSEEEKNISSGNFESILKGRSK